MIYTLFYFLVSILFGSALIRKFLHTDAIEELILSGFILGTSFNTAINFFSYRLFGFSALNGFLVELALILVGLFLLFKSRDQQLEFDKKRIIALLCVLVLSLIIFIPLFKSHMLQKVNGDLYTGGASYGDLAFHTTLINSFVFGDNRQLQNPVFSGTPLTYAPMMDFLSALLVFTGTSLQQALYVPGILFGIVIICLIFFLTLEFTEKMFAAILTPILFIFNGGAGFIFFVKDWQKSGIDIVSFLGSMTKQYSHLADYNIHFSNIVSDYFLPQRTFLMGFAVGLTIIIFIFKYFKTHNKHYLVISGALSGLLPIIHPHSLIALGIFMPVITLLNLKVKHIRNLIFYYLIPLAVIGIIPMLWIFGSKQVTQSFGRIQLFWMSENENPVVFYLKNIGLVTPLVLTSLFSIKKNQLKNYLPFLAMFVVTNIYVFQPHDYDNMKIMIYWFVASLALISCLLQKVWSKNVLGKVLVPIFIFFLTISGGLSVFRESYAIYKMYDGTEIEVSEYLRDITDPKAVFLTSDQHNHPITSFTGRPIVMGYRGWLWTWGYDYQSRQKDASEMFQGTASTPTLLKKYGISYVVIGPSEKSTFNANLDYYEKNFKSIFKTGNFQIYDVRT